jgi:DNA-binding transcriptional ArsR family regulator
MTTREAMARDALSSPNYDPELVERAILEEVIDRHPERLTVHELALRIVADPDDGLEVDTATNAIRELRRSGLIRYRNDDEVVDPTQAALRAHALLTGVAHGRCS